VRCSAVGRVRFGDFERHSTWRALELQQRTQALVLVDEPTHARRVAGGDVALLDDCSL
jgi:hypothetical protein